MYKEKRLSRSEYVPIRGINYHVLHWGEAPQADARAASAGPPQARPAPSGGSEPHAVGNVGVPLVLVHGWMDVAASWQFVVDALSPAFAQGRTILAPDWRGYGKTGTLGADNFWFPDYLADLDFLLDHYAPGQPVDLVGHSMGGNVAMLYAGVRPERIRKLVNLEGFGMPATKPSQAPGRFAQWMDELKSLHKGEMALKPYNDVDGVARRLMRTNPRLSQDKADWLARHWAAPDAQGQWRILGDAAHKVTNAQLYRVDEVQEIYQRISAPTLAVEASDDSLGKWWEGKYTLAQYHERLQSVPQVRTAIIVDAGHMLHHDQPEPLARLFEDFLS
ncbi:MAG: alpha/beta hydrolase [Polaromonas sp.]|uniref:alpha/beta fold hydrolase n=1 Tax=Polaromonas sp. TaxID=1869339 RepID=UPI00271B0CA0|nr:alpha/beta hydrolase [Polaromonas sp.]MDO9113653.1 alpha/beta hydrolase [Polaromonas sp.]MDP1887767.1 alpha/beta hydrolase [Polaromonas sp.]